VTAGLQGALQGYVRDRNNVRAWYNGSLPWMQYDLAAGAQCGVASGEVVTCSAFHSEAGAGTTNAQGVITYAVTEGMLRTVPGASWRHFEWQRIWFDATRAYGDVARRYLVCHEVGHAQGLQHNPYGGTCMATGIPFNQLPTAPTGYNANDNDTFNQLYGHAPAA
jgi:hypothetical protein